MIKRTSRVLTPATTEMTRVEIAEYLAAMAPTQAEFVRRHMAENPFLWPSIVTQWSNECIYPYGEDDRPLVNIGETLGWVLVPPT